MGVVRTCTRGKHDPSYVRGLLKPPYDEGTAPPTVQAADEDRDNRQELLLETEPEVQRDIEREG